MSFDPLTIGLIGGGATLFNNLFNKPKKANIPNISTFRQPTEFSKSSIVDPSLRFVSPFSTVQEQELFRKQQENLLGLKLYNPKQKLGE